MPMSIASWHPLVKAEYERLNDENDDLCNHPFGTIHRTAGNPMAGTRFCVKAPGHYGNHADESMLGKRREQFREGSRAYRARKKETK